VGSPATRLDTFPDELCEWALTGRINKTTSTHTHNLQTPTETFTSRETTSTKKKNTFFQNASPKFRFWKEFSKFTLPLGNTSTVWPSKLQPQSVQNLGIEASFPKFSLRFWNLSLSRSRIATRMLIITTCNH
jgi:hypothetical protein